MRYQTVLLLVFLFSTSIYAQQYHKPDYNNLSAINSSVKTPNYYNQLFTRYLAADSLLTRDEIHILYYCSAFHTKEHNQKENLSKQINSITNKRDLSSTDYNKILTLTQTLLSQDPFDLDALFSRAYACRKLNKKDEIISCYYRANSIIAIILASGNGRSKTTPFAITDIHHANFILELMGRSADSMYPHKNGNLVIFNSSKNSTTAPGIYFSLPE